MGSRLTAAIIHHSDCQLATCSKKALASRPSRVAVPWYALQQPTARLTRGAGAWDLINPGPTTVATMKPTPSTAREASSMPAPVDSAPKRRSGAEEKQPQQQGPARADDLGQQGDGQAADHAGELDDAQQHPGRQQREAQAFLDHRQCGGQLPDVQCGADARNDHHDPCGVAAPGFLEACLGGGHRFGPSLGGSSDCSTARAVKPKMCRRTALSLCPCPRAVRMICRTPAMNISRWSSARISSRMEATSGWCAGSTSSGPVNHSCDSGSEDSARSLASPAAPAST